MEQDWQYMRVTFDYTELENLPEDKKNFRELFEKQGQIVQQFFKNSLLTKRNLENNKYPQDLDYCYDKFISWEDKTIGIENSDLHIYMTFSNQPQQSHVAFALPCVQRAGDNKPIFGLVSYNIGNLNSQDLQQNDIFEYLTEITIHEITHVVGFTKFVMDQWINPQTGNPYLTTTQVIQNNEGQDETWLVTPKVKEFAQKHYNCSTMPGMKLENQGGRGSVGSHWEKVMIENEYMTADTVKHDAIYSNFTFALLEDSGWYLPTYKNVDPAEWGKNKGCQFVTSCHHSQFREFQPQQVEVCNFHHNSVSKVYSLQKYSDNCPIPSIISTRLCIQPSIQSFIPENQSGEHYGEKSACFKSNIQSTIESPHSRDTVNSQLEENRCLKHECDQDGNIFVIILGEKYLIDPETNNVQITPKGLNTNIEGYVEGPQNPYAFCFRYPKPCPNFCSKNGYCMHRQCHCSDNYGGYDCSVQCDNNNYVYKNECLNQKSCPEGTILNIYTKECEGEQIIHCSETQVKYHDECLDQCPQSTFKNEENECEPCGTNCLQCLNHDQCEQCQNSYSLHLNSCVKDCPSNYYIDQQQNKCEKCHENCSTCQNSNSCETCIENYHKPETSDLCILFCFDNCEICQSSNICLVCKPYKVKFIDLQNETTDCLDQCPEGFFKDTSNICQTCNNDCKTCNNLENCTQCKQNLFGYYNSQDLLECLDDCPTGYEPNGENVCELCNIPGCGLCTEDQAFYQDECIDQCPEKMFMENQQCYDCHESCQTCSNKESCDTCANGFRIDDDLSLCRQQQCTEGCDRCYLKYEFCYSCQTGMLKLYTGVILTCHSTCPIGYYRSSSICRQCHKSCKTCTSYSICSECNDDKEYNKFALKNDQMLCLDVCPSRTMLNSETMICEPCRSDQQFYNGKCVDKCPMGSYVYRGVCKYNCGYPCDYSIYCGPDYKHIKFGGQYLCYEECPENTRPYYDRCQ